MASVFVATDERLGRRVAVKLLADNLIDDPAFVKRFQQEAESAAKLAHPNIVSVYDVGEDMGRRYIVMELVNGRNLKDIIVERGPLPMETTINLGAQVLDGLEYAHQHSLVHRDIKPQNILVTRDGTAKLADFGIAKAVDVSSATQTAVVLGSAHYLSPEQAQGEPVSFQSDIYAVGVVLYEMCTGVVPFDGANLLAVASRHINELPAPPSSVNDQVPPEMDAVVLRALEKEARNRYETAVDLKQDLLEVPAEASTVVHVPSSDIDVTQHNMSPASLVGQDGTRPADHVTTFEAVRPSIVRYILWAALLAIGALMVNRSHGLVPASLAAHWPQSAADLMSAVIAGLAILMVAYGFIERARHRYTIDEHAVTIESGIVSHHRDAIPLPAIVNLQLHQSPLSRLLNLGTIVLTTVQVPGHGPATLELHDVAHASRVYDAVIRSVGAGGHRVRFEAGDPALEDLTP
jgi:membrane protein YdbS with pleckstrin-like domain